MLSKCKECIENDLVKTVTGGHILAKFSREMVGCDLLEIRAEKRTINLVYYFLRKMYAKEIGSKKSQENTKFLVKRIKCSLLKKS